VVCSKYVSEKMKGMFDVCEDSLRLKNEVNQCRQYFRKNAWYKLSKWSVNLTRLRGEGFDGASQGV